MTDNSPAAVVARFWELYNSPETILETTRVCAEDCVHEQAATAMGPAVRYIGRGPQANRIRQVTGAFSEWQVRPLELVANGEHVACRYEWTATSRVALPRFVAGAKLRMEAACFFTVRDGMIVRMSDLPGAIVAGD